MSREKERRDLETRGGFPLCLLTQLPVSFSLPLCVPPHVWSRVSHSCDRKCRQEKVRMKLASLFPPPPSSLSLHLSLPRSVSRPLATGAANRQDIGCPLYSVNKERSLLDICLRSHRKTSDFLPRDPLLLTASRLLTPAAAVATPCVTSHPLSPSSPAAAAVAVVAAQLTAVTAACRVVSECCS